ncbi:MAG: GNAT family N-acetyltransferase [bacterium]
MRPLIVSCAKASGAAPDELDDLLQVQTVRAALWELGYDPRLFWFTLDLKAAQSELKRLCPPFVFNLLEGLDGKGSLIHLGPAILDALGLTYTGCSAESLLLCSNKLLAKRLLRMAGLRTPDWVEKKELGRNTPKSSALILKSVWEHASAGLDEDSLVMAQDCESLEAHLARKAQAMGTEVFAEQYIEGREFNVSLLEGSSGPEVLPVAEILFQDYEESRPRIVCYKAKWDPESFQYHHTPRSFDFPDRERLVPILGELALRCWSLFSLRGYARVDIRLDCEGRPWILEVNPNPCISPDAGFMAAASQAGLGATEVVARILEASGIPRKPLHTRAKPRKSPDEVLFGQVKLRQEVLPQDVASVRSIVVSAGIFSQQEVDVAVELVQEALFSGPSSGYHFLFAEKEGRTIGYACYGPIACTASSFDLYWIAVEKSFQGEGTGNTLLSQVENLVVQQGGTRLYVETSSRAEYEPSMRFYTSRGYVREASLENFYSEGDHKLILVKELV